MIDELDDHLDVTRYYYVLPDRKQRVVLEVLRNGHCHVWREGLIKETWLLGHNPRFGEQKRYCFDSLDEATKKAVEVWAALRDRKERLRAH